MNLPRRSFLSAALSAVLGVLLPGRWSAEGPPVRVVEREGAGGWEPIWLAEARAGDRLRLLHDPLCREHVLAADPVRLGPREWRCTFEHSPAEKEELHPS